MKVSIVGSLRDREVACSASHRQGSNFESCVWRTVSSQSSHHPQEVLLAQFSIYVHKSFVKLHIIYIAYNLTTLKIKGGLIVMIFIDYTMAKVVSARIAVRPSCILQRVVGLVSPEDRRPDDPNFESCDWRTVSSHSPGPV